ncbi:MAG: RNA 2',3'-cyclic phosphodiesterase [Firmicutes bacterium]|nr:RNA 2',3'-cyclic phosphodiesterase [Bacillota bacterium]
MMRLFIGIGLPPDAREALRRAVTGLALQGRATAPDNYHLTLAFLGEHDERLQPMEDIVRETAQTCAPFPLAVSGFGFFGRRDSALLYAKLQVSAPLGKLAHTLRARLSAAGETYDEKPFAAHITLVRQANLTGVDPQTPQPGIAFPAERLTLFHSARVQGVLRYRPVFEASFKKEDTLV